MSRLRVQAVSTIPRDKQVRDYDQLSPIAKQVLAEFANDRTAIMVSSRVATSFDRDEVNT